MNGDEIKTRAIRISIAKRQFRILFTMSMMNRKSVVSLQNIRNIQLQSFHNVKKMMITFNTNNSANGELRIKSTEPKAKRN